MDAQALNRFSYCYNNPLRYIDPSGHNGIEGWTSYDDGSGPCFYSTDNGVPGDTLTFSDGACVSWDSVGKATFTPPLVPVYVFVGGSGQKDSSAWADIADTLGVDRNNPDEVIWIPDWDGENPFAVPGSDDWDITYDITHRKHELVTELSKLEGCEIHIIGFSEGAASVGMVLCEIGITPSSFQGEIFQNIQTVTLLEAIHGWGMDTFVKGYNRDCLDNLPTKLNNRIPNNIRFLNVYNKRSLVQGGSLEGWNSKGIISGASPAATHNSVLYDAQSLNYIQAHINPN